MAVQSDVLASMYAYIVNGGEKSKCHYVTDDESAAAYDAIAGEVKANPDVMWEVPSEIPGAPGEGVAPDGDNDYAPSDGEAPAEPAEGDEPEAPADEPEKPAEDPEDADEDPDDADKPAFLQKKAALVDDPLTADDTEAAPADEGRFFTITDAGEPEPWALARYIPDGDVQMWVGGTSGEWVSMPFLFAYVSGNEPGSMEVPAARAERFKATIKPPPPGAVAMMRGDDQRLVKSAQTTAPSDNDDPDADPDAEPSEDGAADKDADKAGADSASSQASDGADADKPADTDEDSEDPEDPTDESTDPEDEPEDPDDDEDDPDKKKPGKPKKGVNPFPPKK